MVAEVPVAVPQGAAVTETSGPHLTEASSRILAPVNTGVGTDDPGVRGSEPQHPPGGVLPTIELRIGQQPVPCRGNNRPGLEVSYRRFGRPADETEVIGIELSRSLKKWAKGRHVDRRWRCKVTNWLVARQLPTEPSRVSVIEAPPVSTSSARRAHRPGSMTH